MGSISLTAVNAFGDPGAARRASARLADHDHERMIAISAQLHDRIAALAVVGGPLAILLGRHEGLTMPTLVVSDRVGRRERRSAPSSSSASGASRSRPRSSRRRLTG